MSDGWHTISKLSAEQWVGHRYSSSMMDFNGNSVTCETKDGVFSLFTIIVGIPTKYMV